MTVHEQGFFSVARHAEQSPTTPFGLSLKEPMFQAENHEANGMTHGIEPSPTANPHGGDGGVDIYID